MFIGRFFTRSLVRLEIKELKLIITSFQFFIVRTKEIELKEGVTYTILEYTTGFLSKYTSSPRRVLIIYNRGEEFYKIKDVDVGEEEMDQAIAFFRVNVPESFKRVEE